MNTPTVRSIDFYGKSLRTYKANLHTHTTRSDGTLEPQDVIRRYAEAGYSVLNISDHHKTIPISEYDSHGMTVFAGAEFHPPGPRGMRWHLLCVNVPETFEDPQKDTAAATIDAVRKVGGMVYIAHPYWLNNLRAEELLPLGGYAGIEVYNAACVDIGRGDSSLFWDELLSRGLFVNAIAADDMHRESQLFRGWIEIACESNTPLQYLNALQKGSYYSTQGPVFTRLYRDADAFEAEFTDCRYAVIMTSLGSGVCDGTPFVADADENYPNVTSIRMDLNNMPTGHYVRCCVQDIRGRWAWSNPIAT